MDIIHVVLCLFFTYEIVIGVLDMVNFLGY